MCGDSLKNWKQNCLMIQQSHCQAYTLRKAEGKETRVPQKKKKKKKELQRLYISCVYAGVQANSCPRDYLLLVNCVCLNEQTLDAIISQRSVSQDEAESGASCYQLCPLQIEIVNQSDQGRNKCKRNHSKNQQSQKLVL